MTRTRTFQMLMPDVYVGEIRAQAIKNQSKEQIGERHFVKLMYIGGYVEVEIDKMLIDDLPKSDQLVTAKIEMCPKMSGRQITDNFSIVDTGFENFRFVGFEPKK